jgi:hypothetical protein
MQLHDKTNRKLVQQYGMLLENAPINGHAFWHNHFRRTRHNYTPLEMPQRFPIVLFDMRCREDGGFA